MFGFDIIVIPDTVEYRPKMQLSLSVHDILSPQMIAKTNAWMVEFFGTTTIVHNIIPDADVYVVQAARKIYMNPRTHADFVTHYRG